MTRGLLWLLIAGLLLSQGACSKKQPAQEVQDEGTSVDHIVVSKTPPSNNFLHKTFTVTAYEESSFSVPAHIIKPVLHGSFVSFAKNKNGDMLSNQSADVDLLLLNDEEFDDFTHNRQGTATYTLDPSHSQAVTYAVPATVDRPQTYHLVFRNSPGGSHSKLVKADFTISLE
jgi:hypothetical protein